MVWDDFAYDGFAVGRSLRQLLRMQGFYQIGQIRQLFRGMQAHAEELGL